MPWLFSHVFRFISLHFLSCFILNFFPREGTCYFDSLFSRDTIEAFGQLVGLQHENVSSRRWLDRYQSSAELRLSLVKQSITFILHEPPDQSRVRLESLFTARGFNTPEEPSFADQSDFSLRSGYLMGNRSVRMTGFILDGLFSGFVDGSANGVEVNVRAKFATFLSNGQTYILTRKKMGLIDDIDSTSFCGYQKFAGNYSESFIFSNTSFEYFSKRPATKRYCRITYTMDPKATALWLKWITSDGPLNFRIRQLVGVVLTKVYVINSRLLLLPLCETRASVCNVIQLYIGYKDVEIFSPDFCQQELTPNQKRIFCYNDLHGKNPSQASVDLFNELYKTFPCRGRCTCILTTAGNFKPVLGLSLVGIFHWSESYFGRNPVEPTFAPNILINLMKDDDSKFLSPTEAAIITTHEIGHQLGGRHDEEYGCGTNYIMSSKYFHKQSYLGFTWSNCSKMELQHFYGQSPKILLGFPTQVPCLTNALTERSCLSSHQCCDQNRCVVIDGIDCSPTGTQSPECCTEACKWANGRKCWGAGDRQCMTSGFCALGKCNDSVPLLDGTRCARGICVQGRCSAEGICKFLGSRSCTPAVDVLSISNSSSCFHHCIRGQNCETALLSDGKPVPLALGQKCILPLGHTGFCSLSGQCLLIDTSKIDWRRELSRSIPLFFHPIIFERVQDAVLYFLPGILLTIIMLMITATYFYLTCASTCKRDITEEIYIELMGSKHISNK